MESFQIPHSENVISFTKVALPYGWLGNMAPFPVKHEEIWWKTTEHLFQALRFAKESPVRLEIHKQASPMGAKMIAKKYKKERVVEQFSQQDLDNMVLCLKLKIQTHRKIRESLFATAEKYLIEDVTDRPKKNDPWGMRRVGLFWVGANVLGLMWMTLRSEFNQSKPVAGSVRA